MCDVASSQDAVVGPRIAPLDRAPRVLLGLSGSVASIKWREVVKGLQAAGYDVRVVATKAAMHFVEVTGGLGDSGVERIYQDDEEWREWRAKGDDVLHIELRRWADALVIAPLSANTLAKMASGMCDNLLTSVVRAWDFAKPLLVCPAMNTLMWESPFTAKHLAELRALGVTVVGPISKTLACGDTGSGAMSEPADVVAATLAAVSQTAPGQGIPV